VIKLGTPLTTKRLFIRERDLNPDQPLAVNLSQQETLLSSFQENTEEEELSFLRNSTLEAF
jgi:hypothetical protein